MAVKRYEIDMSQGSIWKNMLMFVVPLMLSGILQHLYSAADTIVVGRWAGSNALAAVGSTSSLTALLTNIFIGLSIGASVLVSKKFGAGDQEGIQKASHTTVSIGVVSGIVSMIIAQILCRPVLKLLGVPGDVIELSVLYIRIVFLGVPAQMVYNFGAAIFRSVGDTKRPLYILSLTGLVNVALNLLLVIGFNMSVAGVAIATSVANYLSAAAIMYSLMNSDAAYRIDVKKLKIHKEEAKQIFAIGLPAGLQSMVFSLSNLVVQSGINSFGTATMAGRAAASNIENFVFVAMDSFQHATLTAVGQNYGAKNEKGIYKSILIGLLCSTITGLALGLLVYFSGEFLLSFYIVGNEAAIKEGMVYITVCGLPFFVGGLMNVMSGTLRGFGHSKFPATCSLIGACGTRLLWIYFILPLRRTSWFLYMCWPISWFVVFVMHVITFAFVREKTIMKMYNEQ